jgi:hypothetical protein
VGGQGKTELRKKVHQRIEKQRADGDSIAVGVLDFEVARHRSPIDAMLKLRLDLGHRLIAFPTFDLAFAQLFTLERPGDNIRTTYPGLFRKGESEILEDLLGWAGEAAVDVLHLGWTLLPGVEMLYKYSYRLIGGLRDWLDDREVKSRIQDINTLSASELREKLPVYLGFDLWRAMQAPDAPRVVLLIDTYEALWRGTTGQGAMQMLRTDDWVRSLVEQSPGALVVIFGRDKLRWGEIDSAWSNILQPHLLGGLSKEDANLFLYKAGVVSESIRARIVEGAQGLPFYLDLALDQFENLKANGLKPRTDDFGSTPVMVLHRFLDHLSANEESELRLASYPEDIDKALFLDLARAFLGGIACVDWARLRRRSFTSQDKNGRSSCSARFTFGCSSAMTRKPMQRNRSAILAKLMTAHCLPQQSISLPAMRPACRRGFCKNAGRSITTRGVGGHFQLPSTRPATRLKPQRAVTPPKRSGSITTAPTSVSPWGATMRPGNFISEHRETTKLRSATTNPSMQRFCMPLGMSSASRGKQPRRKHCTQMHWKFTRLPPANTINAMQMSCSASPLSMTKMVVKSKRRRTTKRHRKSINPQAASEIQTMRISC